MIIACNTNEFSTDRWNFTRPDTSAIDTCGHVASGINTTTGHQLYELGGIPERELERLT